MTTAPVLTVAPAGWTAGAGVPHEGVAPAVGGAEVAAAGTDAPAGALTTTNPPVAPLVDTPVHGGVTGGTAGVGAAGTDVAGGFGVPAVPAGGEAPAVGGVV
ncbi:MAG: hypothetical protein WBQ18_02865, partial [Solirubrobacteraceae bacterium]